MGSCQVASRSLRRAKKRARGRERFEQGRIRTPSPVRKHDDAHRKDGRGTAQTPKTRIPISTTALLTTALEFPVCSEVLRPAPFTEEFGFQ